MKDMKSQLSAGINYSVARASQHFGLNANVTLDEVKKRLGSGKEDMLWKASWRYHPLLVVLMETTKLPGDTILRIVVSYSHPLHISALGHDRNILLDACDNPRFEGRHPFFSAIPAYFRSYYQSCFTDYPSVIFFDAFTLSVREDTRCYGFVHPIVAITPRLLHPIWQSKGSSEFYAQITYPDFIRPMIRPNEAKYSVSPDFYSLSPAHLQPAMLVLRGDSAAIPGVVITDPCTILQFIQQRKVQNSYWPECELSSPLWKIKRERNIAHHLERTLFAQGVDNLALPTPPHYVLRELFEKAMRLIKNRIKPQLLQRVALINTCKLLSLLQELEDGLERLGNRDWRINMSVRCLNTLLFHLKDQYKLILDAESCKTLNQLVTLERSFFHRIPTKRDGIIRHLNQMGLFGKIPHFVCEYIHQPEMQEIGYSKQRSL